jgi:ADP-ribose pyrophosphatase YjhB (NUDIX family)
VTEVVARAVIIRAGRLLLVQELATGYWFFPGGHVEDGESPRDAVVRELREEIDVGATVVEALGEVRNDFAQDGVEYHEVDHVYVVEIDATDPVSQEPHLAFGWHRLVDLDRVDIRPRVLVDLVLGL